MSGPDQERPYEERFFETELELFLGTTTMQRLIDDPARLRCQILLRCDPGPGIAQMSCRMVESEDDNVVDSFGKVHGVENLYLAGSEILRGTSGAVNPTLTIVALALRTADRLEADLCSARAIHPGFTQAM